MSALVASSAVCDAGLSCEITSTGGQLAVIP